MKCQSLVFEKKNIINLLSAKFVKFKNRSLGKNSVLFGCL